VSRRLPDALAGLVVLVAASRLAAADLAALGGCRPVDRPYDAVEVPGAALRLKRSAISRLGVLAFRGGTPAPVPFQVDERRGRKLALADGPEPTADDQPGTIDADDLVVVLPCDLGEAASPDAVTRAAGEGSMWREVRVRDPVDGTTGFAYVVASDAPPRTDRRYVAYTPAGDFVQTAAYRVGLVNALPTYLATVHGGSPGPNLLDGLRLRAEAHLRGNLARFTLDEQRGRHSLVAWRAGPVRTIRRSRHWIALPAGIQISAGLAHTYFYPRHVFGPGSLKLPFSPGIFFNDIHAFGGADGRDLRGWRYHAPGVPPAGFAIDGHMDDAEKAFSGSGDWFVLAGKNEALLFVTRMSPELARVVPLELVYRDDAERPNPPEAEPGTVPLVGYEGRGVERLPKGRYTFAIRILFLDGYRPGDERRLLAQIDQPLEVDVPAQG